jgi:hypothetical protein
MSIEKAIAEELTLSYMQAGRSITSENVVIVAQSMARALDFHDEQEVHDVFKRARDMADVPTQMVLKQAMQNHRAENASQATYITYGTSEDKRPVTKEEKDYIYAWWHLHGTRIPWLDDEKAKCIVTAFEVDPKNREFVNYQNGWTHVSADNVMKYGTSTMRTRL